MDSAHNPCLILASTSPRRRDLLDAHGYSFKVSTVTVDEIEDSTLGPDRLVRENARLKANSIKHLHPQCVILAADTVVALGNRILGKPADMQQAAAMLADLNGRSHVVHSGVCLLSAARTEERVFVVTTTVRFHALSAQQQLAYLNRIQPLDKAGAYAAQDDGGELIAACEGSFSNVVGLPMEALESHLAALGV
ncbi:MAG: septum formation protein Maf, partial [Verrucomicrobia bacterium]|nr:septum formation protein Maf [Verrucomicrobiota bacterium]